MNIKYESRYAIEPNETKQLTTETLRSNFLIDKIFEDDTITWVYSHYDRYMIGGVMPIKESIELLPIVTLQKEAKSFLERRELGVINIGRAGMIKVNETVYEIGFKEALYIGSGVNNVTFSSCDPTIPAKFYLNSAPAHKSFPTKKITRKKLL